MIGAFVTVECLASGWKYRQSQMERGKIETEYIEMVQKLNLVNVNLTVEGSACVYLNTYS